MNLRHLIIFLIIVGIIFIYTSINPNKVDFLPKCPFFVISGLYCPGCGSQRATHQLLNFNFLGVLKNNILYVFGIIIISYHFSILAIQKFSNKEVYNYIYHPKTPIIILIFILLFWVLRNIPCYPFNLLAPN